ncbi:MAG: hypothetical protein IJQ21_07110 [Lachnospiraceae bacterium]|nr:hypothetical protein [Lachnospiraceae bacterium]
MQESVRKKRGIFPLFLLVYVLVFIAVSAFLMTRLYKLLVSYEAAYQKSLPEGYAADAFTRIASGDTDGLRVLLADESTPGTDDFNNLQIVQDHIRSKSGAWDMPYDKDPGEPVARTQGKAVYEYSAGGMPFARLTLTEEPGALDYGFSSWRADTLNILDEACLPSEVTFHLPGDATAYVNGIPLDRKEYLLEDGERITLLDTLVAEKIVAEETIPTKKTVSVRGLFFDPKLAVRDADGNVIPAYRREDGVYEAADFFAPDDFVQSVSSYVEGMLEPWGLFFSRDGGYYNIQRYFLPGSPVDRYLPNVDVSWMQYHNRVAFENKRVENYRLFTDRCFSCDVHFEQIIGVGNNPEVRRWNTDMTWIFVRREGSDTWLLADMMTLTGSNHSS